MNKEDRLVAYFYESYEGRVPIGVGYHQDITAIYPLVFENSAGASIGLIALGVSAHAKRVVHIYHLAAFISGCGSGSEMLSELCRQADDFDVDLSVSAVVKPNGNKLQISTPKLVQWYKRHGFKGDDTHLLRESFKAAPIRK